MKILHKEIENCESWKDIPEYRGKYQISNLGNVKSLNFNKERILKPALNGFGYLHVILHKDGNARCRKIHQLVAEAFLNHKPNGTSKLVVNHIDFNKTNNKLENLEIISNRENTNRKHLTSTSKYVGVCWDKSKNKWRVSMYTGSKLKHLGYFKDELKASEAYQKALSELKK